MAVYGHSSFSSSSSRQPTILQAPFSYTPSHHPKNQECNFDFIPNQILLNLTKTEKSRINISPGGDVSSGSGYMDNMNSCKSANTVIKTANLVADEMTPKRKAPGVISVTDDQCVPSRGFLFPGAAKASGRTGLAGRALFVLLKSLFPC